MSTNLVQCLRDTAQLSSVQQWLREECGQAADRIEALEEGLRFFVEEGDGWYDDSRGGGKIPGEKAERYRRLLND